MTALEEISAFCCVFHLCPVCGSRSETETDPPRQRRAAGSVCLPNSAPHLAAAREERLGGGAAQGASGGGVRLPEAACEFGAAWDRSFELRHDATTTQFAFPNVKTLNQTFTLPILLPLLLSLPPSQLLHKVVGEGIDLGIVFVLVHLPRLPRHPSALLGDPGRPFAHLLGFNGNGARHIPPAWAPGHLLPAHGAGRVRSFHL
mmetsp:Transcript_19497/g.43066  ORF Transcript_19497/g.43066 Transcript_19497/m.43066 type:complete len:203 (+) Transcript_19497:2-610(+)